MLQRSSNAVGALGLTLLLLPVHAGATTANSFRMQRLPTLPTVRQPGPPVVPRGSGDGSRNMLRRHPAAATGCMTDYGTAGDYFVGVSNNNNYAAGYASAILGGTTNEACDVDVTIGGGEFNVVHGTAEYGASNSAVAGGTINVVTGVDAMIGSGAENEVDGAGSFIAAGDRRFEYPGGNTAPGNLVTGEDSFVGTGDLNNVSGNGSFIGAGGFTYADGGASTPGNQISGADSFIGAGDQNAVASTAAFVGSGSGNKIAASAKYASILGGVSNSASGQYASVIGGYGNAASGAYAIVAGGNSDAAAGILTFAAGYHANASHNGSFVWSDYSSGSSAVKDTAVNQFVVRASGGTFVYSNEAATAGVKLGAGSGTWASLSDRNAKTDIVPLDDASILAKVAALPISTWQYRSERGVRHAGPMAQDFYAAFGIGEDDRHITSIDEDGIALSAVRALNAKLIAKCATIERLERRLAEVEAKANDVGALRTELRAFERKETAR